MPTLPTRNPASDRALTRDELLQDLLIERHNPIIKQTEVYYRVAGDPFEDDSSRWAINLVNLCTGQTELHYLGDLGVMPYATAAGTPVYWNPCNHVTNAR